MVKPGDLIRITDVDDIDKAYTEVKVGDVFKVENVEPSIDDPEFRAYFRLNNRRLWFADKDFYELVKKSDTETDKGLEPEEMLTGRDIFVVLHNLYENVDEVTQAIEELGAGDSSKSVGHALELLHLEVDNLTERARKYEKIMYTVKENS